MGVSLSSYYFTKSHLYKGRYTDEEKLSVYTVYMKHFGSFGRRTLKKELSKINISMSEKKISSIMKELNLKSKYGRRKCKNIHTAKYPYRYIKDNLYPNLTKDDKTTNEIISMDITEQKIENKKIFTCAVISLNSKEILALQQSDSLKSELVVKTLKQAISNNKLKPYMVLTDRRTQFVSRSFNSVLDEYQIRHSMSRPYKPVDNIFIETFWKTMKTEIGKTAHLTKEQYEMIVRYYIYYYNNKRPHSSLNYYTPKEYREKLNKERKEKEQEQKDKKEKEIAKEFNVKISN